MRKKLPISVVCATHNGRKKIPKLINSIYCNTFWPKEIIICGTKKEDFDFIYKKKYKELSIKTIVSNVKNQIVQRNRAIKKTQNNILLQLDDDIELDRNYINLMYQHFKNKKDLKKIVSAAILFRNKRHQAIRWNATFKNSLLFRNILYFFNFFKELKYMSILQSGRIAPKLPEEFLKKKSKTIIEDIEWVCSTIGYNKKCLRDAIRLRINNSAKAFYEDVFFSHSLYKKGYRLIIDRSIIAYHPHTAQTNLFTFIKTIPSQWKIVTIFNKSLFLFFVDVIAFVIIHGLIDLSKIFKKR
jgi:glycosyltransferase involved in cell wall biosynthesis